MGCLPCPSPSTITWKQNFSPTMLPCTGRTMTFSPLRSSSAALGAGSRDSWEPLRLGALCQTQLSPKTLHAAPMLSPPPSCLSPSVPTAAELSFLGTMRPFRSRSLFHNSPCRVGMEGQRVTPRHSVTPMGDAGTHLHVAELRGGGAVAVGAFPRCPRTPLLGVCWGGPG